MFRVNEITCQEYQLSAFSHSRVPDDLPDQIEDGGGRMGIAWGKQKCVHNHNVDVLKLGYINVPFPKF